MAFVKFQHQTHDESGRELHWCRSDLDGMPFRGASVPLRNDEFDELTETSTDSFSRTFNTSDPEQNKEYREVLDGYNSGWYKVLYRSFRWIDRKDGPIMFVYIEWAVPHKEVSAKYRNSIDSPTIISLMQGSNGNGHASLGPG